MMQENLDNGIRLGVFQELKGRMREEIWGERGMEREGREQKTGSGMVDSRVPSPEDEERTVKIGRANV